MADTHWPTPALLLALLVGYVLLLEPLGYALATTVFVWLDRVAARLRRPVRDVIVGLGIGRRRRLRVRRSGSNVQLPTGPWGV